MNVPTTIPPCAAKPAVTNPFIPAAKPVDFSSVLGGKIFKFLIGPQKKTYNIHAELINKLSQPLKAMIGNGMMQESIDGCATLEDVDPQTFVLFSQYAYTGMYRVRNNIFSFGPPVAGNSTITSSPTPNHIPSAFEGTPSKRARCDGVFRGTGRGSPVGLQPSSNGAASTFGTPTTTPRSFSTSLDIRKHQYPAEGMDHQTLRIYLLGLRPVDLPTEDLASHAKLYVFANKYMIEPLPALCLHKLHRDLACFLITESNIIRVTELLTYTFNNTSSRNGTEKGVGSDLKELVMAYAAGKAEILLTHEIFKDMLVKCSELGMELFCLTATRL